MSQQAEQPRSRLLASTVVVSVMTLRSRVLGLVRDIVLARLLGASAGTDAFFVAFRIPNFLRRLFAEGAFNQAFIPVLSEYKTKGAVGAVQLLVNRVAGTLGVSLAAVTMLGVIGAPVLITVRQSCRPASLATLAATSKRCPNSALSEGWASLRLGMCWRGITSRCTGACG